MTDEELTQRAAIAYGLKDANGFSPLTDDGDALRLAVKLRMFLDLEYLCAQAKSHAWFGGGDDPSAGMVHDECDPYAATRRAIVRAAAAMGEKA